MISTKSPSLKIRCPLAVKSPSLFPDTPACFIWDYMGHFPRVFIPGQVKYRLRHQHGNQTHKAASPSSRTQEVRLRKNPTEGTNTPLSHLKWTPEPKKVSQSQKTPPLWSPQKGGNWGSPVILEGLFGFTKNDVELTECFAECFTEGRGVSQASSSGPQGFGRRSTSQPPRGPAPHGRASGFVFGRGTRLFVVVFSWGGGLV